jgi:NAD-dependent dihydropyrimidine dehydrogenase PreA subunit
LVEAVEAGLTEPVSLHPVIDAAICVGSAGCVDACPEQALGIIGGKAQLISPAACIGHGACADACPVSAITLVFGTERRGVDIPMVNPDFETNIPGIFIAGELGGMGLIRKASEQGRQAIKSIATRPRSSAPLDVIIVGAGPPPRRRARRDGTQAALPRDRPEPDLGGAIFHFPRNKIAMTAPVDLPSSAASSSAK